MVLYDVLEEITLDELILRGFFALGIIIIGVLIGKIVDFILRKISEKSELNKHVKRSFIDLTLLIIRWSIYIIAVNIAIKQLGIPIITDYLSMFLITIPTFVGGLLLIVFGFALAFYLKKIIKNSETKGWEFVSQLVFYFTLAVFGIYSMRIALEPIAETARNSIIIISFTLCLAGAIYYTVSRELKKQHAS
ncbi:hypothetical protein GF378_01925 [Candidatus Pacearchaeota archaeon]|nr:hypothetical protein [Candidatus Pacearchaeota archaeon]